MIIMPKKIHQKYSFRCPGIRMISSGGGCSTSMSSEHRNIAYKFIPYSTIIVFFYIIHRLVFCLRRRPVYVSKHNISETGFYFIFLLIVVPTKEKPIFHSNYT
jgi:hypothetical protein